MMTLIFGAGFYLNKELEVWIPVWDDEDGKRVHLVFREVVFYFDATLLMMYHIILSCTSIYLIIVSYR